MLIAYGTLSSNMNKKEIANFNFKNTNVYVQTKEALEISNISDYEIHIDVFRSNKKRREKFQMFIEKQKPSTIFLQSIFELGANEDLVDNYLYCLCAGVNLMIFDAEDESNSCLSKYSTVDFKENIVKNINNIFNEQEYWNKISNELFLLKNKSHRGKLNTAITKDFLKAYWNFEKYLISPENAYSYAHMAKKTFVKVAVSYEQTPEFNEQLEKEEKLYHISLKPKRLANFPNEIEKIIELVDNGISLQSACTQTNNQPINAINFKRIKMAYKGGRKVIFAAREYTNKKEPIAKK